MSRDLSRILALLMAWMLPPSVMASTLIKVAHCDAVGRGHASHQQSPVGAKTAFIAPGSPWENGYCESFNSRFREELLNGEVFYTLREAQILI
jgi:transposase InsO family protein